MPHDLTLELLDWLALGLFAIELVLIFALVVWAYKMDRATEDGWNDAQGAVPQEGDGIGLPAPALAGWYGYGVARSLGHAK